MEAIIDPQDYKNTSILFHDNLKKIHECPEGRLVCIKDRRAETDRALDTGYSKGKAFTHWRGVALRKYPVDFVIIQQLLWEVKPATVLEMGAHEGGSALWMADTLKSYGCESHVYSVDIDMDTIQPLAKECEKITFVHGDLTKVAEVLPEELLKKLPHPWFMIEDSHVNLVAILDHLDKFFQPGDYICIEDTCPNMPGAEHTASSEYEEFGPAKLLSFQDWLNKHSDKYMVDAFYNDFYGYNVTANWNGYIKRVK